MFKVASQAYPSINLIPNVYRLAFFAINLVFLTIFVPVKSLLMFYIVSLFLIIAQAKTWVSVSILTLALLYFRSEMLIFDGTLFHLLENVSTRLSALFSQKHVLSTIGISYCYLRVVYALTQKNLGVYGFTQYYFFFPTYFSGPIINPGEFLSQSVRINRDEIYYGISRVIYGLLKFALSLILQLLVPLSSMHNMQLALQNYSVIELWIGAFSSGLWLFLNFSGFSDIAIGISHAVGIRVPENFSNPYASRNLTDFWRCWHITLGNWLRIFIYNPMIRLLNKRLSEQSILILIIPALITMAICGLWHGLTLSFLIWGMLHGIGIAGHMLWSRYARPHMSSGVVDSRWYRFITWFLTHAYVTIGWVFFFPVQSQSLHMSLDYTMRLLGIDKLYMLLG